MSLQRIRARHAALTTAIALALTANCSMAQDAPPTPEKASQLDTVVVTGTRATGRTVSESLAPIDVLGPRDLQATGTTELATALARALPSLNFPRPSLTDGTDGSRPAQLRGLSPDQVLVLVNGKRRHTGAIVNLNGTQGRGSSPVDLNAIPIEAVDHIEVLRDGAAAQYGSDAIAGVINIVLKGGATGGSVNGTLGKYSAGDGIQRDGGGDIGFALGKDGWIRVAGDAGHDDPTNRAGPDLRNPADPSYGRVNQRFGDPDVKHQSAFVNAQYNLAPTVTLYAFGNASNRNADAAGFWRPGLDSRNIRSIYPDGFLPIIATTSKDRSLVAGIRGQTAGWNWDFSGNYGQNQLQFDVDNSLNTTIGPTSPTHFYAGTLQNTEKLVNLDVSKDFDVSWLHSPLTFAWGGEYRHENYEIDAGDPTSYAGTGAQVFPGFRPSDSGSNSRHSYAAYAELDAEVTEKLSASAAARYEKYSDFGNTVAGKLSARYAFTDKVALRATASNGFRAPSLAQQFYSTTSTVFINSVPYEVRTFPVTSPVAQSFGAQKLKAEKSTNYSLGLVVQPTDATSVTVDAYQIRIGDRIVLSENLTGTAVAAFLAAQGYPGVNGGRYFTNAVDTRTRGVDIVGSWRPNVSVGTLDLNLGYNYNKTDILNIAPNPPQLSQNGLTLQRIGRVEQGRITKGSPRDKLTLGGNYRLSDWGFRADLSRYGQFTVLSTVPANDQTFSAKWVLDLAADYNVDNWTFTLGADNIFDKYPDKVLAANSTSGILPYSSSSPFGFNGAFVYGKVAYRWK
ncbi:iron complex outermembrane receptor protein [Luteibacter rhizovicinus]|uniref:Iron complex outermembrane receptor protein n=1 Tax=Luteibacter rhizovicinus TaxID=242606 RepID=A0A4R3YMR4_9GAMM|nr:TonB-dependent receptor [Luteibacter rhizovicinus]TCV93917.1 iron complex outermembrane receptor protein [Luteibacter rhizovicinus]